MKTRLITYLLLSGLICLPNLGRADPQVGLYKITVRQGWNCVSLPLQTLQRSQGQITSLTTNTLTDSNKSWTENAYQYDVLLICSGTGEGYYYRISANTADTLTLSSALSSTIAVSDRFYIYEAKTISGIFGDHNGALHADTTRTAADEIYLWDSGTQALSESIWLSNEPGSEGWWQGDTQITDKSVTLLPNEACFVVHKTADEVTINIVGVVPDTKQTINVRAGETLAGQSFPVAVTAGNSGLDSTLQSGVSSYSADNVYIWDYAEQKFKLPLWHSNAAGYENFYCGADNMNSLNLNPGEGYLIRNRGSETNWQREKPY